MTAPRRVRFAYALALLAIAAWSVPSADAQPRPVGTAFQISGDAGNDPIQGKPAIIGGPSQFFVVYRKAVGLAGNQYDIYGTRVALDGTVLDPGGIAISTANDFDISPGNQYFPSVGFDGTNYMVVWVANRNPDPNAVVYEIFAARVTPTGVVLDPGGVQVTSAAGGSASPLRMPSIVFDGMNYLVTWRSGPGQIWGTRMSTAGVSLDPPAGFQIGTGFYPYAAFDGTNVFVVWHSGGGQSLSMQGAMVSKAGAVVTGPFEIAPVDEGKDHSSVAFDGANYLVVWHDFRGGNAYNDGSAYGARVSPAGTVLDVPAFKIADYVRGQVSVRVLFDGTSYFVVWQEDNANAKFRSADVFGRRVAPSGAVLDRRSVTVGASSHHQFAPVSAYKQSRYLVAWGDTIGVWGQLLAPSTLPPAPVLAGAPVNAGWAPVASPVGTALFDVFGFSDSNVFAVGEDGVLLRSSGAAWTPVVSLPSSRKLSLWGTAPGDVWAAGSCHDVTLFDGTSVDATGCLGALGTGIWAAGRSGIVTVGIEGTAIHYEGNAIGQQPQLDRPHWVERPTGVTVDLWDVWGSAYTDVYAVGELGVIRRFDGTRWTGVPRVPTRQGLNAIWGRDAHDIFAVGDSGTVLHYDGTAWSLQATPTTEHLLAVWGCSAGKAYAVGMNGTILRYDGATWRAEVSSTTHTLFGVWGGRTGIVAVGDQGTIVKKSATCALPTRALTVTRAGTGGGRVTSVPARIDCGAACVGHFDRDTPVTLTAVPNALSEFIGWSGACTGTGACAVTMSAAQAVTATFGRLAVTSFTPAAGAVGTVVTINGVNLDSVTAVRIGGVRAPGPTILSPTRLRVAVPPTARTGVIEVASPAGSALSATTFTVLPRITGFTPAGGPVGTLVTITGTTLNAGTVKFGTASASVVSRTSTEIVARVPAAAVTGPITVTTPSGSATSAGTFTVSP